MRQKNTPEHLKWKKNHCSQLIDKFTQNLLQNLPWNFGKILIIQGPFQFLENSPVLIGSPNGQGILVIFHDTAVDERSLEFKSLFSMAEIRDSPVELGSLSHELQGYSKVSWILEPSTVGIQADGPPRREGSSSHTTRALYIHYESGCLHQKAGMAYIFPWITYIYLIWI